MPGLKTVQRWVKIARLFKEQRQALIDAPDSEWPVS
jgi:hypothetical protein